MNNNYAAHHDTGVIDPKPSRDRYSMRSIFLLVLLACGAAGCAAPAEQRADAPSAAPQPKPGTVTPRMNGEYVWMGGIARSH